MTWRFWRSDDYLTLVDQRVAIARLMAEAEPPLKPPVWLIEEPDYEKLRVVRQRAEGRRRTA